MHRLQRRQMTPNDECSYCQAFAAYELLDPDGGGSEPICIECIGRLKRMLGDASVTVIDGDEKERN
jgi:hypothetical protein